MWFHINCKKKPFEKPSYGNYLTKKTLRGCILITSFTLLLKKMQFEMLQVASNTLTKIFLTVTPRKLLNSSGQKSLCLEVPLAHTKDFLPSQLEGREQVRDNMLTVTPLLQLLTFITTALTYSTGLWLPPGAKTITFDITRFYLTVLNEFILRHLPVSTA